MKNENLTELITNHWFDQFQSGLSARFSANRMDYSIAHGINNMEAALVVYS